MGALAAGVAELRESQAWAQAEFYFLASLLMDAFVLNKYKRCLVLNCSISRCWVPVSWHGKEQVQSQPQSKPGLQRWRTPAWVLFTRRKSPHCVWKQVTILKWRLGRRVSVWSEGRKVHLHRMRLVCCTEGVSISVPRSTWMLLLWSIATARCFYKDQESWREKCVVSYFYL